MNIAKKNARIKMLLNIMLFICLAAFVFFAARGLALDAEAQYAKDEYDVLGSVFEAALNDEAQDKAVSKSAKAAAEQRAKDEPEAVKEYTALITGETAKTAETAFNALREKNDSVAGWIKSSGTPINYPIMQGKNNSYYINHLYNDKANHTGAIFMDAKNSFSFSDQNTIIYGHHMNNGSMFASIANYRKKGYYRNHPSMTLYTPEGTYLVELFAGYSVGSGGSDTSTFQFNFSNDEEFEEFVDRAKKKSTFNSFIEVGPDDRIITLCTCTYEIYNGRYVLHGKLTRI